VENWCPEQIFDAMHHRAQSIWPGRIRCDYAILFMNHRYCPNTWSQSLQQRQNRWFTGIGTQRLKSKKYAELKKFIKEHRLGTLHVGEPVMNPNSGNTLIPAMWIVNVPRAHAIMSYRQGRRRTWPR
jgi:hypothetical protein